MECVNLITIHDANEFSREEFVSQFGWIFEHTPWVAEQAWELRPFPSVQFLHRAMVKLIEKSSKEEKLALIQAHPDLGTKMKLSTSSKIEQQQAGLDQLSPKEYERFIALNNKYVKKYGFPFVLAVRGHNKDSIYDAMKRRVKNKEDQEFNKALEEIYKISFFRLREMITNEGSYNMEDRTMYYGKGDVYVYRTNVQPLTGLRKIPESNVTEINNIIFGWNIKVEVEGKQLFTSFSEGDNELVVATDSMKNFIHKHLAYYNGRTIEGFLAFVAERFLDTYPQMDTIKLIGEETPFLPTNALLNGNPQESNLVFNHSRNEQSVATLFAKKNESNHLEVLKHISGIKGLQLVKIKGNSFAGFIRDEYTTLPEDYNRPLFIYLNISWNYEEFKDSTGETPALYVYSKQVKDIVTSVFHKLDTLSIQHLIYQIGLNILVRFPQLTEVTFESQNRTWETVVDAIPDSDGKVYTEPRPPYGFQGFTLTRDDLKQDDLKSIVDEEISQI